MSTVPELEAANMNLAGTILITLGAILLVMVSFNARNALLSGLQLCKPCNPCDSKLKNDINAIEQQLCKIKSGC